MPAGLKLSPNFDSAVIYPTMCTSWGKETKPNDYISIIQNLLTKTVPKTELMFHDLTCLD